MSQLQMFAAPENGAFSLIAEFPDSWGGASRIWSALCDRYLGAAAAWALGREQELWSLASDPRLTRTEQIVLQSTFDRALVSREHFGGLAQCYREFQGSYPLGGGVCHLTTIADLLDALAGDTHSSDSATAAAPAPIFAVGWRWTTAMENLWWVQDGEEGRPYDLGKDAGHWFLFAEKPPS